METCKYCIVVKHFMGFSCEILELKFILMGRHLVSHWESGKDKAFSLQKVKIEAGFHTC